MGVLVDAVEREIAAMPQQAAESSLAALALVLARELDSSNNSATSKSMNARALLDTLEKLRELVPPVRETSKLDELTARRIARRAKTAS